jgi:hypothetical protein
MDIGFARKIWVLFFALIITISFGILVEASFTTRTPAVKSGSSLSSPYNFVVNKPTGTVNGDIMFMFLTTRATTSIATVDTVPDGWTLLAYNTVVSGTSYMTWYLYYKIASDEGTSYTWSLTKSTRYYAVNTAYSAGDFDVQGIDDITVSNTLYGTAGTAVRAASMNVPNANSPLVSFDSVYTTTVRTFTEPSVPDTWIEDYQYGSTTPDISGSINSMIWTGSGDTGDMDATCSASITNVKHAFAVALNPVAAGDTTPPLVTINSPQNITYYTLLDFPLALNVSLDEEGSAMYSIDGGATNISLNTLDNLNFDGTLEVPGDGQYTFRVYANDTAGNKNYSESRIFNVATENVIVNGTITDTLGNPLNSTVEIIYSDNGTTVYDETGNANSEIIINASELYNATIIPHDLDFIQEISLDDINLSESTGETTNLIEAREITNDSDFQIIHVINPIIRNFRNAKMKILPGSRRLYECSDWNTGTVSCDSGWALLNNSIAIGQEYEINIGNATVAYGEIPITNALHLDSAREFISNIYDETKAQDGIWSEEIPSGDYVRVTFLQNLTSENDITIYPKKISGTPSIEVYEKDGETLIANFTSISDDQYNQVLLTSLEGSQDIFDLHVVGGSVEFDHIKDPIQQYNGGLLVYANATAGLPVYRTYDDASGFGAPGAASSVGSAAINWMRVAASPTKDEWIIVTKDSAATNNVIKAQVCNGTLNGIACGTPTTISSAQGTATFRNFDIAYEQLSGNAMLVYGTSTADELRKIQWINGAWTNDTAITTTYTSGTIEWVEMASRANSDQVGIAYSDTNDDVSAYRWDGSSLLETTSAVTTTATTVNARKFDIAFEGTSGDMFVAAQVTAAGTWALRTLSGTTWASPSGTAVDQIGAYVDIADGDPTTDDLAIVSTTTNVAEGAEWSGSAIVDAAVFAETSTTTFADSYELASVSYVSPTYTGVGVYSDTTGPDDVNWYTMNSGGTWTLQSDNLRTRGTMRFLELYDYPSADKVLLLSADSNSDLWADTWDGSGVGANAWTDLTSGGALETSLSTATKRPFDFAFRLAAVADTTAPTWSSNSTNSTLAGSSISHNVFWADDAALSGYIFSFDNGNGTLYNDTWAAMDPSNWTNVSKTANSTADSTIRWMIYANDSSNNFNATDIFSYQTTGGGADSCTCTDGIDWAIINGDQCSLSTACNLGTGKLRVMSGALRITSAGQLNSNGCYVHNGQSLYVENGGKLICRP